MYESNPFLLNYNVVEKFGALACDIFSVF